MKRSADDLLAEVRLRIERVSAERAFELQQAGALLVDIRPVAQRQAHGEVPGALIVERNVLEWRLDPEGSHRVPEANDHGRKVLVLCQQGYASSFAAASLGQLGYERPADVIGGFDAWTAAGLPVTRARRSD